MNAPQEMPANLLSEQHLEHAQVWRFLAIGESADPDADESQVRADQAPGIESTGSFLVASTFTLKAGARLQGLVQVDVLSGRIEFTPCTVFAKGRPVTALGRDTASRIARILRIEGAQPVSWQLDVLLAGEQTYRHGVIARPGLLQALGLLAQLGRLRRAR